MAFKQGDPMWVELNSHVFEESTKFYSELLGWEFQDTGADFGHYNIITLNGERIGGAMNSLMTPNGLTDTPQTPTTWTVYLKADNIIASVDAAQQSGATVILPPMKVGSMGKMAIIADGAGAPFGLWEYGEGFNGSVVNQGVGTPAWFEVMTTNLDAAVPTYKALGWKLSWMDDSLVRYGMNATGEEQATASICDASSFLPEGTPSFWRTYFTVANTDASVEKIKGLGGSLVDGPAETPYGRLATVAGPEGAHFQIVQDENSRPAA